MEQNAKSFADALNKSLDDLGVPTQIRERAVIFSKMLNIPKQQAWALLDGHLFPDENLLELITAEIELDLNSLN